MERKNITIDACDRHKELKRQTYWFDLSNRETNVYSQQMIDTIINFLPRKTYESILNVGCGTSNDIVRYKNRLKANKMVCIDYDKKIIEQMKIKNIEDIQWKVADICNLKDYNEKYDIIFLCDMLHEVYSFYGRPEKDINKPIDHQLGLQYVTNVISNLVRLTKRYGGIIITDDVFCKQNTKLKVILKGENIIESVKYFLKNYSTKFVDANIKNNILSINSKDFSILLTQYNKIKIKNWDRWNIERLETHQYMNIDEYEELFNDLGCITYSIIGTPKMAYEEWRTDFEISDGLSDFPEKRITLLAAKLI